MMLGFRKSQGEIIQSSLASTTSNMLKRGENIYKHLCIDSTA